MSNNSYDPNKYTRYLKKKSGFFRSITILELPQLGIVKKEIKIMICTVVLKRPKNKPSVRDFFCVRNERAC